MVKKLFVSSLQRAKAHDEPASPLILGKRLQDQKRELSEKMLRLRGTDRERAVGMPMPLKFSARELLPLQFFGGAGSTTVPKSFKIHDRVSWNSEAGRVSGTVIRVHTRDFDHSGYTHHASPGRSAIRDQERQDRPYRFP
jgi:hypothetical protein